VIRGGFDETIESCHGLLEFLRKPLVFLISPGRSQIDHLPMKNKQAVLKFIVELLEVVGKSSDFRWIDNGLGHERLRKFQKIEVTSSTLTRSGVAVNRHAWPLPPCTPIQWLLFSVLPHKGLRGQEELQMTPELAFQRCIDPGCLAMSPLDSTRFTCPRCGGLMDVAYDWPRLPVPKSLRDFEAKGSRRSDPLCVSGVWRFIELLPFAAASQVLTIGEGQTILQRADAVARFAGLHAGRLYLQYEGLNPSGSFKDNGMSAAFTHAMLLGARRAACASTGNTSASLALFCSATGLMRAIIFIGSGKIA
jgi:hypothetical protein